MFVKLIETTFYQFYMQICSCLMLCIYSNIKVVSFYYICVNAVYRIKLNLAVMIFQWKNAFPFFLIKLQSLSSDRMVLLFVISLDCMILLCCMKQKICLVFRKTKV